jgi:hypothetical protein
MLQVDIFSFYQKDNQRQVPAPLLIVSSDHLKYFPFFGESLTGGAPAAIRTLGLRIRNQQTMPI